jgi:hypothetical protein
MRKKLLWTLPVLALAFVLGSAIQTHADTSQSGRGWLWGGGVTSNPSGYDGADWISMNNVDESGAPVNEMVSYGVNIPSGDGAVLEPSYAWSHYYGWISFNAADLSGCPSGTCTARREGNMLKGWARILGIKTDADSGNSGGWSGWIKLSPDSADSVTGYGVDLTKMVGSSSTCGNGGDYSGCAFAWSDELGWIDFSWASIVAPRTLKVCQDGCDSDIEVENGMGFTMSENQSRNYRACYNTAITCDAANATDGNVTNDPDTAWAADDVPDDAIALSGTDPKAIAGNNISGVPSKTEGVGVTYNSQSVNFPVTVTCTPTTWTANDPGKQDLTQVCSNESVPGTNDCGVPENKNGLKNCNKGTNWKEVAP